MKKIFILTLLLIITTTSCKKEVDTNPEKIIKEFSEIAIKYIRNITKYEGDTAKDITMTIKEGTLTNDSATVVIKDLTGKEYIYNNAFGIFKKINNDCIYLNHIVDKVVIDTIGYMVRDNNPIELEIKWGWMYGKLKPGEYKIIKDNSLVGSDEHFNFSADFTIK